MCLCLSLPWNRTSKTTGSSNQIPKYTNHGQHSSGQGSITNITTKHYHDGPSSNPLEELNRRCSHNAAFDSVTRFLDASRCADSTRLQIIRNIEEWVNNRDKSPSVFWLHGGAGERCNKEQWGIIDPDSCCSIGRRFAHFVEDKIRENRALFTKTYEVQIQELLIEPLLALKSNLTLVTRPRLIVIDGLDECQNRDIQCELLRVIARAIPQIPYPLRFLITSRPEAHIRQVFDHEPDLRAIPIRRYNLSDDPDADMDIRKVFEKEFAEIFRVHRLGQYLPHGWPGQESITSLVERSSGHFIYASTVTRYIRSPKHRPDDRLGVILRLQPPQEGDRPYAQLDALYALIFAGVESRGELEKICLVLGILHFQSKRVGIFWRLGSDCTTIEGLLDMKAGDLLLLLDPMLSLVAFYDDKVRILHKSLHDYLLDSTRGGYLPINLARVHELAATYVLKRRILKHLCDIDDFREFAYHCQYAHLSDALKDYLNSLEVPFPKSVGTMLTCFPQWHDASNEFMRKLIWHSFRTLNRVNLDPTGQIYEHYLSKWVQYIKSFPSCFGRGRSCEPSVGQYVDDLKHKLDDLLTEWQPQNFNQMDVGTDQVDRIALVETEHRVFSDFAGLSFLGNRGAFTSSLVLGGHFIHSYILGLQDKILAFVVLRTYSRHGNLCYQVERIANRDRVVQEILDYVGRNEEYLFSDLYQKYGILEVDVVGTSHSIQKTKAVLTEL